MPIGGPLTGRPSERVRASSSWHRRDSSPSAARSVKRAIRTDPERLIGPTSSGSSGRLRPARRVVAATGALTWVVVLGGHRRHEAVEARLPGELGMECGRDDIPLPDGDDPSVVETGQDVDPGPGHIDDRCPDEDAVHRPLAEHRYVDLRLERVELATEGVPLDP